MMNATDLFSIFDDLNLSNRDVYVTGSFRDVIFKNMEDDRPYNFFFIAFKSL